jgi:uncharacterized protein DUF5413
MKRYLIFAAIGPFVGGFIMLFTTAYQSGYWTQTNLGEVGKLFVIFAKTLQYSYLFGIIPVLAIAAIDDILAHVRRIGWVARVVIIGVVSFVATELLYGSRGPDTGAVQFILYGLVGLVPGILSSWLSHKYADEPQRMVQA